MRVVSPLTLGTDILHSFQSLKIPHSEEAHFSHNRRGKMILLSLKHVL